MWYKFKEGKDVGTPRIEKYEVLWYDMTRGGDCYDVSTYSPNEIDKAITYVETVEDVDNEDRTKVFAYFDNGDVYELKLKRVKRMTNPKKGK